MGPEPEGQWENAGRRQRAWPKRTATQFQLECEGHGEWQDREWITEHHVYMAASLHFILQVMEPIQEFQQGNDKTYFCLGQITNHEWDTGLRRSKVYSATPVSIINCVLQMRNDKGLN